MIIAEIQMSIQRSSSGLLTIDDMDDIDVLNQFMWWASLYRGESGVQGRIVNTLRLHTIHHVGHIDCVMGHLDIPSWPLVWPASWYVVGANVAIVWQWHSRMA